MVKKIYALETKLSCIEMKKTGKSDKVIMYTLGKKLKSGLYLVELVSKRRSSSLHTTLKQTILCD
ncbi:hypothetical protein [Streptococcus uberis]|uniref:hypothetical protein n=1 Tax=Streptococcus uberis TaxID=1349 RepID=UPI0027DC04CB|nr:hypothetical protein [Streptococcus uberis]MCK1202560.1 hypothetical protein [Streptococcus uberis]